MGAQALRQLTLDSVLWRDCQAVDNALGKHASRITAYCGTCKGARKHGTHPNAHSFDVCEPWSGHRGLLALEESNISVMRWTLIEGVQCPIALLFYFAKSTGGLSSSHKHTGIDTLSRPSMRTAARRRVQYSSICFWVSIDINYFKNYFLKCFIRHVFLEHGVAVTSFTTNTHLSTLLYTYKYHWYLICGIDTCWQASGVWGEQATP